MKKYFVYILKCADDSFYTGVTNNPERRLHEHQEGIDPYCYTAKRRPLSLEFVQEFPEILQAIAFEKQVKGWSKKKKLALISGDWRRVSDLAQCKNDSHSKNFNKHDADHKSD